MKKMIVTATLIGTITLAGNATTLAESDSLRMQELEEVVVKAVRGQKNAPFAVANIRKQELQTFASTGRELPFLFCQTPGVMAWSDNGMGTGTSYLRIRGTGDSRINVTIDGVPLNSPEDQCVFWANMNSYSSLMGSVQIQRGVGSSTNGDGAFGGTISLMTRTPNNTPEGEISFSYGSYNTMNMGGAFSTGLLCKHLSIDGAYHETRTDGFIDGTSGRSGSYFGRLEYQGDNIIIAYKNIGNFEKTGQAWNGVTAGSDDLSLIDGTYGTNTGIKTYKDLYDKGLGQYNSLYERLATDNEGNFIRDANGNYQTERYKMNDGSTWDKTTDNFWQNHNILSALWNINSKWATTATIHYTHGYGYYNEFRYQNKLKKFGLSNLITPNGTVKRSDFVRKKGLSQDTYGLIWNANFKNRRWDIIGGLSIQQFDGHHFGFITYVGNDDLKKSLTGWDNWKYYDSDAHKLDGNVFAKALYHLTGTFDAFIDMQYRHVSYKTDGYNDKYIDNGDGSYSNHYLDIDKKYNFFNPKAGFSFQNNGHRAFFSVNFSHREPERNNFTDNGNYPAPKAESLLDFEAGYSHTAQNWQAGVNIYYMKYNNQFVQTGVKSDIGEALTTNIKNSYRTGIELTAAGNITSWLSLEGNAALSLNKIKDFEEYVEDWDDWEGNPDAAKYHCDGNGDELRQFHYDNSTLAFSPSVILNGLLTAHYKGWQAVWHTGFVSRQYLDNTENKDRSLPAYTTTNVRVSYSCPLAFIGVKEAVFALNMNNIFNAHFAASGWVYSAIAESYGHNNDNRYYQIGFVPMAGFTTMGSITLRF